MLGNEMHALATSLWPICRSLTGEGNRQSLAQLQQQVTELSIHEIETGTECFDWTVPREWEVNDAYIITPEGKKIACFKENNLHLVNYSVPVQCELSLEELQPHLYSLPQQQDAIPYVTSYYKERWGFCITQKQRESLKNGQYKIFVDTKLKEGSLSYGEILIPGETDKEVFLSTYICHPSMANDQLSGPVVTTFLAKWLLSLKKRKYSYRIIFVPETIGAIAYLSLNLDKMKENIIAGFNIACVGDNRSYSLLPSKAGNLYVDKVARHVLEHIDTDYKEHSFLERGSDERQYCSPGIDLPVTSVMRTKYGCYPEYHTSLDDLINVVTAEGLQGGYEAIKKCLEVIERNGKYKMTVLGEPQLGKRGLYPTVTDKNSGTSDVRNYLHISTYCDGDNDLLDIANLIGISFDDVYFIVQQFLDNGLVECLDD